MNLDAYRIANAFQQAAIEGHYEQCKNIIQNFAHVYRKDYREVLSMVSVMLMDPSGFTADEYKKVKTAIRLALSHYGYTNGSKACAGRGMQSD